MALPTEAPCTQFRIFVSSTFEDLKAERAVLAERVFPRLRDAFLSHGVSISDIDLRWGITQDESILGRTLELCLAEVEACRPYLLIVLADRYGWVPEISDVVRQRHPWIAAYAGRSITELEIRFALHDAGDVNRLIFCYARETAGTHGDGPLAALKRELASLPYVRFQRFADIAGFEAQVVADLSAAIRREARIDEAGAPSPVLRRAYHAVRTEAGAYRPVYRAFAEALAPQVLGGGIFGVIGAAGAGKTTALLQLVDVLGEAGGAVPGEGVPRTTRLLLPAFAKQAGTGQDFRDLVAQLHGWLDGSDDIGLDIGFRDCLDRLAVGLRRGTGIPVVVVLDDIDGFERPFFAERFLAFFATLPPGSACVFTLRDDSVKDYFPPLRSALRARLTLQPVPDYPREDISGLIRDSLAAYGKRVSDTQLDVLGASPLAASPAFLMAIIDGLRLSATFASLDLDVQSVAGLADLPALYATLISRRRDSLDADGMWLMTETLRLLAASEFGLREEDMRVMLDSDQGAVPALRWSPVYLSLKPFLREQRGRLAFRYAACREAALSVAGEGGGAAARIGSHLLAHAADEQDYIEAALQACRDSNRDLRGRLLDTPDYLAGLAAADWTVFKRLVLPDAGDDLSAAAVFRRRARYDTAPAALALLAWAFEESGLDTRDAKYQRLAFMIARAKDDERGQVLNWYRNTIRAPKDADLELLRAETERGDYGLWTQLHLAVLALPYDACVVRRAGRGLAAHFSTDWSSDPIVAAGGASVTYYIGDGSAKSPNGWDTEKQPMLRALKKVIARHEFASDRLQDEVLRTGATTENENAGRTYVNWLAVGTAVAAVTGNIDYASKLIALATALPLPEEAFAGWAKVAGYLQRIAAVERDRDLFCCLLVLKAAAAMRSGDAAATGAAIGEVRHVLDVLDFSHDRAARMALAVLLEASAAAPAEVAGGATPDGAFPFALAAGIPAAMQLLGTVDTAVQVDRHVLRDFQLAGYVLPGAGA